MRSRIRSITTGAVSAILLAGIALTAAAPVLADHSAFIPADENGCGFDILAKADHLPGVARAPIGSGDITFTNLETGASYLQHSRYTADVTFDASTKSYHITITGRIWTQLYPGEPGPNGVVEEPGLELLTDGVLEYTLNRKGVVTAFSLHGTYQDLCALLI
jgi:hypothetical protein